MAFSLSEIPTDRVVWIKCFRPNDLDLAVANAPLNTPAVLVQQVTRSRSQNATVASTLDEMEVAAGQLFPAWLPGVEGIVTSAGAAVTAVRAVAFAHAAETAQYGPFLADLAIGALARRGPRTRRHPPEVRVLGLARVLAASFGRPACALLLQAPDDLDESEALALVRAAQWLVDCGRLAVWICGESLPAIDWLSEIAVARPGRETVVAGSAPAVSSVRPREPIDENPRPRRERSARRSQRHIVVGKPHPTSRAEVVLEAVLADRAWAAGRAWNHTIRPGPLVNPVRVDLLWKRERCIVEIDGDDHRAAGKYAEDRHRDVMLQLNGYAVLRFTNTQVLDDIENVLALLQQFLANRRRAGKGN
ncbi:endonuclease domain-containing protein [Phytohabitans rumicis]|uniref:endonuclease domain-containing protein n=1 Tax=Phytohabitans rumicis TaxID=1076125 RepID=UPI0031E9FBA9